MNHSDNLPFLTLQSRALPQLSGMNFMTDGGLETCLIFHQGIDLPDFAAFVLLENAEGRAALRRYFDDYLAVARAENVGIILDTPTWRASRDWGARLGYSAERLARINAEAVRFIIDIRCGFNGTCPAVTSAVIGPRGDGYQPDKVMTAREAEAYHSFQACIFAESPADMISAVTMTHVGEAAGIALAARATGIPVAISFTVETDGRLPDGTSLEAAIREVDEISDAFPAYYMINCAHPSHFEPMLARGGSHLDRIRGVRANASRMSHAELDEAEELDDGNPGELGEDYGRLKQMLGKLNIVGGCCGTDHRHVRAMVGAL